MQTSYVSALVDSAPELEARSSSDSAPISDVSYTVGQLRTLISGRDIDHSARPSSTRLHRSRFECSRDNQESLGDQSETGPTSNPSRFLRASRLAWKRKTLSNQFPAMSTSDRERIFPLYEPRDVDVLVSWTCSQSSDSVPARSGQLLIFGLSLGPSHNQLRELTGGGGGAAIRSMYAQTAREKAALLKNLFSSRLSFSEDPLVFRTELESRTRHDFAKG